METIVQVVALACAAIGTLGGVLAYLGQRRTERERKNKLGAETIDLYSQSITRLLEPLNSRIDELEEQNRLLRERHILMSKENIQLESELLYAKLGIEREPDAKP